MAWKHSGRLLPRLRSKPPPDEVALDSGHNAPMPPVTLAQNFTSPVHGFTRTLLIGPSLCRLARTGHPLSSSTSLVASAHRRLDHGPCARTRHTMRHRPSLANVAGVRPNPTCTHHQRHSAPTEAHAQVTGYRPTDLRQRYTPGRRCPISCHSTRPQPSCPSCPSCPSRPSCP